MAERGEEGGSAVRDFVLLGTGPQSVGEVVPEPEETGVGHFQDAAHVGRLGPVQEQVSGRAVAVDAMLVAVQQAQRHQSIEEVRGRPRVETHCGGEGRVVMAVAGQRGENSQLHRAEKRLGSHEAQAELKKRLGGDRFVDRHDCLQSLFQLGS